MRKREKPLFTTMQDIWSEINRYKAMTDVTIYKHLRALKIRPLGEVRQCPLIYPPDTAKRILNRLGIRPRLQ